MHIRRKAALDARRHGRDRDASAHTSACARAMTTIGDCSFSGAAATRGGRDRPARDRLPGGLRSRRVRRSSGSTSRASASSVAALGPRRPRRLPARAVHVHDRGLPRLRRARAAAGDALRRERRRARLARRRDRGLEPARATFLVPPPGETGIRLLAAAGLLGPDLMAAHCVHADAEEIALLAAARRRRRALSALERLPRLRRRAARGAARRRGSPVVDRDRQPGLDAVARPVRGDPRGDRRCPRPRAAGRTRSPPPTRSSSRRSAAPACSGWTTAIGSLVPGQAGRPGRRSRSRTPRSIPWKILLRQPSWAAPRPRHSYSGGRRTALPERNVRDGPIRQEQHEAPEAGCCRSGSARRQALDRAVDRGHDVLPAAAAPRQVDVRLPRRRARRRLRASSASAPAAPVSATSSAAAGARAACRRSRRRARRRPRRTRRTSQAWRDLSTALQTDGQTDKAIDA